MCVPPSTPLSVIHRSHLVSVPTSANELSEALMTSPIIGTSGNYGGGSDGGATGGGGGGFDFGVDPSQDPELAMVSVHMWWCYFGAIYLDFYRRPTFTGLYNI